MARISWRKVYLTQRRSVWPFLYIRRRLAPARRTSVSSTGFWKRVQLSHKVVTDLALLFDLFLPALHRSLCTYLGDMLLLYANVGKVCRDTALTVVLKIDLIQGNSE